MSSVKIIRSGSKITVAGGGILLATVAAIVRGVILVDPNIGSHVTFSEKFWPVIHHLIFGW